MSTDEEKEGRVVEFAALTYSLPPKVHANVEAAHASNVSGLGYLPIP